MKDASFTFELPDDSDGCLPIFAFVETQKGKVRGGVIVDRNRLSNAAVLECLDCLREGIEALRKQVTS